MLPVFRFRFGIEARASVVVAPSKLIASASNSKVVVGVVVPVGIRRIFLIVTAPGVGIGPLLLGAESFASAMLAKHMTNASVNAKNLDSFSLDVSIMVISS
jgi:hypothetical protein